MWLSIAVRANSSSEVSHIWAAVRSARRADSLSGISRVAAM